MTRPLSLFLGLLLLVSSCWVSGDGKEPAAGPTATSSPAAASAAPGQPRLQLAPVLKGLKMPVHLTAPAGASDLYVVEQGGSIRRARAGKLEAKPFLDIQDRVRSGGEMGLLSLAFHPDYAKNGRFFVNYTSGQGGLKTRISEFQADPAAVQADAASERILLTIDQPFPNHNGGQIAFGPDGYLYIGMGDGGSGGDPLGHGQNLGTLLGALLRIDVNGKAPYGIPSDNPFAAQAGARPEIWAYGLRNPWRFSFDRQGGRLYLADVGQNRFEEINVIAKGGNYGWNIMEGRHCFNPVANCRQEGLALPMAEYGRSDGLSVSGGFVYRGSQAGLQGIYFYGDFGSGKIWGLKYDGKQVTWQQQMLDTDLNISSFGEDAAGEVYVLDWQGGAVYRLLAGS